MTRMVPVPMPEASMSNVGKRVLFDVTTHRLNI